jgi:hypothetical protein
MVSSPPLADIVALLQILRIPAKFAVPFPSPVDLQDFQAFKSTTSSVEVMNLTQALSEEVDLNLALTEI